MVDEQSLMENGTGLQYATSENVRKDVISFSGDWNLICGKKLINNLITLEK